jgi:hypothetical protein
VLRAEEQLEGAGAALAAHELWENYLAQGLSPAQHSQYEAPHEHAVLVEQAVGTELLGGGRLAVVSEDETIGGTKVEHVLYDHGSFFVELTFARSSDEVDAVQRLVSVRPRRALTAQAGRPVVFAPDSSVLSPQARWKLRAVRRMLEGAGPVTVRLTSLAGVADTAATRTRFSLERAEAVAEQILLGEDDESDRVHIRLGDDIEPEPRVEIEMAWPEPDPQVGAGPEADVAREPAPDNAADGPRVPDAEGGST